MEWSCRSSELPLIGVAAHPSCRSSELPLIRVAAHRSCRSSFRLQQSFKTLLSCWCSEMALPPHSLHCLVHGCSMRAAVSFATLWPFVASASRSAFTSASTCGSGYLHVLPHPRATYMCYLCRYLHVLPHPFLVSYANKPTALMPLVRIYTILLLK